MADRFDLDAIEADDAFLDLLAAGGESAWSAGEHDPALKLLADLRLAVEVEDELPVETIDDPESFLARCAALNPVTDPFARKLAARGFALGVAAVAALSVSGVAAAVTGNPLSPYEKVIEKIADGLRPETSFPKEQLDGLPVVDKTKIVKVGKDYRKAQEQRIGDEQTAVAEDVSDEPAQSVVAPKPPFLALPPVDKTSQIETQVVAPANPDPDPQPVVTKPSSDPTGQPTTEPSGDPTGQPTTEPSGDPTSQPTDDPTTQPTEPPATTPPPTEPTEPASTPTTPAGENGSTGNPGETPSVPVTEPSTAPSNGNGETSTGTDNGDETPPGSPTGDKTPPGGSTGDDTGNQSGDSKDDQPAGGTPTDLPDVPVVEVPVGQVGDQSGDPVSRVVEKLVLAPPTGAAVEEPARLEQYFGKGFTGHGKHSSGKPALGWAKSHYAKGKHSTGHYAEGRHAAIARAHGSMAPVTIKQILGVLNTPMSDR
jgi:hypothetical protein